MADYQDFDFDVTQRHAWAEFTLRLDEVLSVMDASADLTISVANTDAAALRPGLRFSMTSPLVVTAYVIGADDGAPSPAEAAALRELGWGAPDESSDSYHTEADQESSSTLAELATQTLTGVFGVLHPVFLEPDQLAEILQGNTAWAPLSPRKLSREETAVMPGSRAELDSLVDEELRRTYRHPTLRNELGDVAIRVGSTMVFLRSTPDGAELVLFSALVHDVTGRSRACEVLNDLNVESRYGRFALHRDRVFVQLSVAAQPFVPAHLHQALSALSQIADGIDDELATKLGGRTTF
ncbi:MULTISPECIES: T3SS (YopN, CesT) and YbjN peptide-binding chaperone 1 [unclassified Tessaracoccus]|uniref:T3SS (YopN, CesT) and YbjN peptide-binding chaperone 1 n=1 Tax=unclassified Tessaracoccus TaxID=2635419 RepID=UPI001603C43C|nr:MULTISPECIES: hypothetical protein [unclassified Tessaracoccus]MBB1513986.1 hypothetical protein [Tessaracoccus sp. MC1627]MBB1516151.1 hypothetical protein [Tessaracoccus sp. MC1679]